jgi:YegS/Rv2252/BmrU family lipid kinase
LKNQAICVILNVGSGKPDAKSQPESIRDAFAAHGAEITLKVLNEGSRLVDETKKSLDEGYKTIVAGGGDGTICSVAQCLSAGKTIMGILPLGTFNYFARSLNIPPEIEAAAKVIVDGHSMPLRVASVNDRMFLNNASLGVYPAILEKREEIYRRWGRSQIAAYWAVIETLLTLRRPLRLKLTVDGKTQDVRTPLVFIVNNAFQLQQMSLKGTETIEAGELAMFIAPDTNRLGMIRLAVEVALGHAASAENFEMLGGKDIVIESTDRVKRNTHTIAKDGERERMQGPFRVRVVQNALRVLVPTEPASGIR